MLTLSLAKHLSLFKSLLLICPCDLYLCFQFITYVNANGAMKVVLHHGRAH